jgi:glycosyltransferase involved in cell wall biosynthesis
MENKLSVVIITFNEEKNIERCINSLKSIADDIVVVDSFSTDRTEELCKNAGVRFFQHEWAGYSVQKNYANSLAEYDWIFSIDADEALSDELKDSILCAKKDFKAPNFRICRITNYCGKWIHHSGWYPDVKVRFFDRRLHHWEGLIHERLNVGDESVIPILKGDCFHYSYYSREGHLAQAKHLSELVALDLYRKREKVCPLKQIVSPFFKFFRIYFIKLGFLDGSAGITIARISSKAVYIKYGKLRKLYKTEKNK